MKIAVVCPYNLSSFGGVQRHIIDSARALSGLGHDVTIISPRTLNKTGVQDNNFCFGSSKIITFNKTDFDITLVYGAEFKKLKKFIKENNFEIIHYHTIWTPFLPLQILFLSESKNVATFHDTPPDNITGILTRTAFRLIGLILFRFIDSIIAVSEAPAGHLPKLPDKKIHIIPPCIDLSRFYNNTTPLINKINNEIVILFIGRLDQRKGIFVLIEAFKKLCDEGFQVKLLIAGTGHDQKKVTDHIETRKLDTICYLGDIEEKDKPGLYASCDIFCSPALYGESFGIVLVEAMASSKPVVAAANKGYAQLLQSQSEYCLSSPGDPADLYKRLRELVLNDRLREDLGLWGLQQSRQYDAAMVTEKLVNLYKETLLFK